MPKGILFLRVIKGMVFSYVDKLVFIQLQHGHKGLGGDRHRTKGTHSLLAFLLLLQQLLLSGDVTAVALGQNILTQSLDGLAGDDLAADGGLHRDLKLGAWDVLLQLFSDLSCPGIGVVCKEDEAKRIDDIAI